MRKINNPFAEDGPENHNCFGCSPNNPHGLHLEFYLKDNEVLTHYDPSSTLEGFPNVLHGGIQALLMDEVSAWGVYVLCKTVGVTVNIQVDYKNPAFINQGRLTVYAKVKEQKSRMAIFETRIENSEGKICSKGTVSYLIYPEAVARKKFSYPGIAAFLP